MVSRSKTSEHSAEDLEKFESFWKDIVCDSRGHLKRSQVIKELADYAMLLEFVPRVYDHITGGRISIPTTLPNVVIAAADDVFNEALEEALKEEKTDQNPITDVAQVILGGPCVGQEGDGLKYRIRAVVPEGEFDCIYDRSKDLLFVRDERFPELWRETVRDAAVTLLKMDATEICSPMKPEKKTT